MDKSVNIKVAGNVDGSIVVGDHNFVVNTNHGTIVYKQAAPQVRLRQYVPQPPRAPRGFVNRSAELRKLETWITANEVVLLHAPDGMGKSALLRQAANSPAAKAMPQGVILIESAGFESQPLGADDVIQQMFDALFESEPHLKVDSVTARTYLSNTRPLILLDEVPLPPMLQRALADLIPQGSFILTADLPTGGDFQRMGIGPLPREEAAQLLAERTGLSLDDEAHHTTLKYICGMLHDISLAVTITGNVMREKGLTPDAAFEKLGAITVGGTDPVSMAIDRAYLFAFNTLSAEERQVLSAATMTPGISMTPEWLSFALGANADRAIERLKEIGLLYANSPRLRMPPGFRSIARRNSVQQENIVLAKLVTYLLGKVNDLALLGEELGNLLGTLAWAARTGRHKDVIVLGKAADPFLTLNGYWDAWGQTLGFILDSARQTGDYVTEAWVLHQFGTRLIGLGNTMQAGELLAKALRLRQRMGDHIGAAFTQHNINYILPPSPPPVKTQPTQIPLAGKILLTGMLLGVVAITALILLLVLSRLVPQITPTVTSTKTPTASITPTASLTLTATLTPTPSGTPTQPDTMPPQVKDLQATPRPVYYGQDAGPCKLPAKVVLSLQASDPSGVAAVEVKYRYENDSLQGDWLTGKMKEEQTGLYALTLDTNAKDQALRALDGTEGRIAWEVTVTDKLGNSQKVTAKPIPLNYARCDLTPPEISNPFVQPNPANYGDVSLCGGEYPTQMNIFAYVVDEESGLDEVFVQYYYQGGKNGPKSTLPLSKWDENNLYGSSHDHNTNNFAEKVLKGENGYFIWKVIATDKAGNKAESKEQAVPVEYHFCPPPG